MEKKVKHILIIPSWYLTKDNLNSGIFFKQQAEALAKSGFKVSLIDIWMKADPCKLRLKDNTSRTINGVYTVVKKGFKIPKLFNSGLYKKHLFEAFKKVVKENGKPDVIHAHSLIYGGYGGYLLNKEFKIPYVITEHISKVETRIKRFEKYCTLAVSNASEVIVVSKYLKHILAKYYKKECKVVHNFFDLEGLKRKEKKKQTKFKIICIGWMDEIQTKGIDILLKALKILINGNNEIYLTVVGDGPNKEKYKEYCTKENISKYVNFLDPMPHKELLHKIRNHSVLVISSRIETFSIVGIEAMGLGLPVIATKCGGPEDYITKETGLVVDKENPKLLAESIIFMKKNLKKYNNKKIAAYANKNFSDKVIINKIINIYKNIK